MKRQPIREGDELRAGGILRYRVPPSERDALLGRICSVVDPSIQFFVAGLIKMGYETSGSCAGHGYRGFVDIEGPVLPDEEEDIKALGKALGMVGLRAEYDSQLEVTSITFKGMGGRRNWFGLSEEEARREVGEK